MAGGDINKPDCKTGPAPAVFIAQTVNVYCFISSKVVKRYVSSAVVTDDRG